MVPGRSSQLWPDLMHFGRLSQLWPDGKSFLLWPNGMHMHLNRSSQLSSYCMDPERLSQLWPECMDLNCHLMVWILADCLNLEQLVWILADPANCDLLKPLPGAQQVSSSEMQIRRRATTAGWQPPSQDISNCAKRGWRVSRVGAAIMTYQFRKDEFGLIYVWQSTWENSGPHKHITLGIDYSFKSEIDCFISTQNRNRF